MKIKPVFHRFDVRKNFISRELAVGIELSSDCLEISINPPLRIIKTQQILQLYINGFETDLHEYIDRPSEFERIDNSKVVLRDGTEVKFKIQLIDELGGGHDMDLVWTPYCVAFKNDLPKEKSYDRLRMLSDKPIVCERICWLDTDT